MRGAVLMGRERPRAPGFCNPPLDVSSTVTSPAIPNGIACVHRGTHLLQARAIHDRIWAADFM